MIADLERVVTLLVNGALARLMPGWRRKRRWSPLGCWPESDQGVSLGAVDPAEGEPVSAASAVDPSVEGQARQRWASTSIADQTVSQDQKSI